MSQFYGDAIFWIDIDKITPNPYQPRREFEESKLQDLSESIRQYGVLQPLVVTRTEVQKEDGGLAVLYELIAGERRLRASKLAGLTQVPAIIRSSADDARLKLELAIIENLQREDLNPVDRAKAFDRLATEFKFKHAVIAQKIGKSREYVANSIRILMLPPDILQALSEGKISEGHTRPLLMVGDKPEEQATLFKEIIYKRLTVREAEAISRRIAYDKIRKKEYMMSPELVELEQKLTESLGTRVQIEQKDSGGKIVIDFFTPEDLHMISNLIAANKTANPSLMEKFIAATGMLKATTAPAPEAPIPESTSLDAPIPTEMLDDRSKIEKQKEEQEGTDLYSIKNFSI